MNMIVAMPVVVAGLVTVPVVLVMPGAARSCARSGWRVLVAHPLSSPLWTGRHRELAPVLLGQLLIEPLLKLRFVFVDGHLAAHLVMAPSAQLGAHQLVTLPPRRNRTRPEW